MAERKRDGQRYTRSRLAMEEAERLNDALITAVRAGDQSAIERALRDGASPNATSLEYVKGWATNRDRATAAPDGQTASRKPLLRVWSRSCGRIL